MKDGRGECLRGKARSTQIAEAYSLSNSALHPHLILKEAGTGVSALVPEQGQTDVVNSYGL